MRYRRKEETERNERTQREKERETEEKKERTQPSAKEAHSDCSIMTAESFRGMERMIPRERPAGKGKPRHGFDANNTESDGQKETKSLEWVRWFGTMSSVVTGADATAWVLHPG